MEGEKASTEGTTTITGAHSEEGEEDSPREEEAEGTEAERTLKSTERERDRRWRIRMLWRANMYIEARTKW